MESVWQKRVEDAVKQEINGSIFAAFNTNVDVVVHLNKDNIANLVNDQEVDLGKINQMDVDSIDEIRTKNEFVAVVKDCLGKGKSFYIVLQDLTLLDWLESKFDQRAESMGGQAGIIANQMASLGANAVVYSSLLSPQQGSMFFPQVKTPVVNGDLELLPVQESTNSEDKTKINWIFEYAKGVEFDFGGEIVTTPRANRVILSTRPEGVVMGFTGDIRNNLTKLGKKLDVAFMAGYHYAPSEQQALQDFLTECTSCVQEMKAGNNDLRFHFEYVPMKDQEAEKQMLASISQEVQSFGINENEIKRVLQGFGFDKEYREIETNERAYALYQGALRLFEKLSFERIQLHNLGYYILLLKKPYKVPVERVRDACLYASAVNAIKARDGGYVPKEKVREAAEIGLSTIGYEQLKGFAKELAANGIEVPDSFLEEGILERDDHYVLLVPAHVVPNPVSTVGMGDTISSSSYACEYSSAIVKK